MWNLVESKLLDVLPRIANPNANASHTLNGAVGASDQWEVPLREMREYAAYEDDWDGQGTERLPLAMSASALELADALRAHGIAPPSCVTPGVAGTMSMEWILSSDSSVEVEVTAPSTADVFVYKSNRVAQSWEIKEAVTV